MSVRFGPAGNSDSYPYKTTLNAPAWVAQQGLELYEYQCGRGVTIREKTARQLGQAAADSNITLSLHSPYYINISNPSSESMEKNLKYILASCQAADWMGASRIVVHSGAVMNRPRREAQETSLRSLKEILRVCDGEGFGHLSLCPETMGKINQLGDLDEVLELCALDERLIPTIDFGHLYARSLGRDDGEETMCRILDRLAGELGEARARTFHAHFSYVEFTPNGGEKCHRTFADHDNFGPDPAPLMEELAKRGWSPTIICESAGTQAEDALAMQTLYRKFLSSST